MATINESPAIKACTELVIVCCHAVYTSNGIDTSESQWKLKPFQKSSTNPPRPSEHHTMILHILAGATTIEADPRAMLVFSGGRTTDEPISEAAGYEKIFLQMGIFPYARQRYAIEENSTDSYQNLLFSILRFQIRTGRYPERITVITYAFKAQRFLDCHAPAIKWPSSRIRVQGIDPPFTSDELDLTRRAERIVGSTPFIHDPYGVQGELAAKRRARNWHPAILDGLCDGMEPSIQALLHWTGGDDACTLFPGALPWE